MITLLDEAEDNTLSRCEYLIRKHAPRLMRQGGGALMEEREGERCVTSAATRAKIVRLRQKGWMIRDIAECVGCSRSVVSRYSNAAGIFGKRRQVWMTDADVARAVELRAAGKKWREVAAEMGYSWRTVYGRVKAAA